jgi:hypothetical protein
MREEECESYRSVLYGGDGDGRLLLRNGGMSVADKFSKESASASDVGTHLENRRMY